MVYFFSNGINVKIGYTNQKISKRLIQLNTGSDKKLYSLGYMAGDKEVEKNLHQMFNKERIRLSGEWFVPSPRLINFINENNEQPNTYVEIDQSTQKIMTYFCI